jgi:hypothetical protein
MIMIEEAVTRWICSKDPTHDGGIAVIPVVGTRKDSEENPLNLLRNPNRRVVTIPSEELPNILLIVSLLS